MLDIDLATPHVLYAPSLIPLILRMASTGCSIPENSRPALIYLTTVAKYMQTNGRNRIMIYLSIAFQMARVSA